MSPLFQVSERSPSGVPGKVSTKGVRGFVEGRRLYNHLPQDLGRDGSLTRHLRPVQGNNPVRTPSLISQDFEGHFRDSTDLAGDVGTGMSFSRGTSYVSSSFPVTL